MGHKKLIRFAEIDVFKNVFQHDTALKGKWNEYFKNKNNITLELACGKGEYSVGLGRLYNDRNLIGIDIKGNRIWRGAKNRMCRVCAAMSKTRENRLPCRTEHQLSCNDEYFIPLARFCL